MQREPRKEELTRQWLSIARRDLLAAERALSSPPPLGDVAVFH
jgi:hypothetical protein